MLFSDVLAEHHHIYFKPEKEELLNRLHTCAAHHLRRFEEAELTNQWDVEDFHFNRYWAAFLQLIDHVHDFGDFTRGARDPDGTLWHIQSTWCQMSIRAGRLTNELLFSAMNADPHFGLGSPHTNDSFLKLLDKQSTLK